MLHYTYYFIRQLLINVTRNPLMSVAAVSTATISLLTLGISLITVYNINSFAAEIVNQVEIRAFLKKDITIGERKTLEEKIRNNQYVGSVEYISPDQALDKLQEDLSIDLELGLGENPLPPGLVIHVRDFRYVGAVAQSIQDMKGIDNLKYGENILRTLMTFSLICRLMGYFLTLLMAFGALSTIINTVRLTIIARYEEIKTMQLVGATRWFIRWPFLLEGLFFGAAGALIAAGLLALSYAILGNKIQAALPFLLPLVKVGVMTHILFLILTVAGIVIGLTASYISLTRFLKEHDD